MESNELLKAISDMMDQKLDEKLEPINKRLDNMDSRLYRIEDCLDILEYKQNRTEKN